MSEVLLQYNDLGSKTEIIFLLDEVFSPGINLHITDIKKFCFNHSYDFCKLFDGVIYLFLELGIIEESNNRFTLLPQGVELKNKIINSGNSFSPSFLHMIISWLDKKNLLPLLFDLDSIRFDTIQNCSVIYNNHIPLYFTGIKQLFYDFGLFISHPSSNNIIIINDKYHSIFLEQIIEPIKAKYLNSIPIKSLSLDRLKDIISLKEHYGQASEEFVLKFEQRRHLKHSLKSKIKIISNFDVSAGYDIVSLLSASSKMIDCFIEVKSFSENINFYWSRNEVNVARIKGPNYFLYLVNRYNMDDPSYKPTIIQDPYKNIFLNSNWVKRDELWFVHNH